MDLHAGECFKCCGCSEDDPCSTSVAFSGSRWLKIREEVRGARSTLATSTITSENEAGVRGKVASYRPESRPRQTGDEPSRKSKSPVHRPKGKSNRPVCGEQVRGRESPARSMAEPRKKRPAARSSSLPTKKPRQSLRTMPASPRKDQDEIMVDEEELDSTEAFLNSEASEEVPVIMMEELPPPPAFRGSVHFPTQEEDPEAVEEETKVFSSARAWEYGLYSSSVDIIPLITPSLVKVVHHSTPSQGLLASQMCNSSIRPQSRSSLISNRVQELVDEINSAISPEGNMEFQLASKMARPLSKFPIKPEFPWATERGPVPEGFRNADVLFNQKEWDSHTAALDRAITAANFLDAASMAACNIAHSSERPSLEDMDNIRGLIMAFNTVNDDVLSSLMQISARLSMKKRKAVMNASGRSSEALFQAPMGSAAVFGPNAKELAKSTLESARPRPRPFPSFNIPRKPFLGRRRGAPAFSSSPAVRRVEYTQNASAPPKRPFAPYKAFPSRGQRGNQRGSSFAAKRSRQSSRGFRRFGSRQ